jgi:hypothetical protein
VVGLNEAPGRLVGRFLFPALVGTDRWSVRNAESLRLPGFPRWGH